tara:strand:- start:6183 stop:6308 length:126 start_codon:yes stop_codon:yes gene_type:complete
MTLEYYYSKLEMFGPRKYKQSDSGYLDDYHNWMIKNGFVKA